MTPAVESHRIKYMRRKIILSFSTKCAQVIYMITLKSW